MPVFSAVGWMIKGGGGRKQLALTNMSEKDFISTGNPYKIELSNARWNSKTYTLSFTVVSNQNVEEFSNAMIYLKMKVDVSSTDNNGGWTSHVTTQTYTSMKHGSYTYTFSKSMFNAQMQQYFDDKNKLYVSFKSTDTGNFAVISGKDPDFPVTIID